MHGPDVLSVGPLGTWPSAISLFQNFVAKQTTYSSHYLKIMEAKQEGLSNLQLGNSSKGRAEAVMELSSKHNLFPLLLLLYSPPFMVLSPKNTP
jgi:hypothetical protein